MRDKEQLHGKNVLNENNRNTLLDSILNQVHNVYDYEYMDKMANLLNTHPVYLQNNYRFW